MLIKLSLKRSLFNIQSPKMAKVWVFYEALKFGTSFKMHNNEVGQNGEDEVVLISFKGVFIMEAVILDHARPKNIL